MRDQRNRQQSNEQHDGKKHDHPIADMPDDVTPVAAEDHASEVVDPEVDGEHDKQIAKCTHDKRLGISKRKA